MMGCFIVFGGKGLFGNQEEYYDCFVDRKKDKEKK